MSEIKIRTIPRSNERQAPPAPAPAQPRHLARVFLGLSLLAFFMGALGFWSASRPATQGRARPASQPLVDRVGASIQRQIYDTHMMEQMMRRKSQIENQATVPKKGRLDATSSFPEDNRNYGVQMDQENTAERVYEDLNLNKTTYGDNVDEKINARLANRKWLNEMERAERINFVRNFIRQAYDRGYEVQLDQNLVVVGVRKLSNPKSVNIDQALDRLAKQGQ